jgi:hypothetical protein
VSTHRKVDNKPHPAPRGFLSKVGSTGSNSCRIAQRWLLLPLSHLLHSNFVKLHQNKTKKTKKTKKAKTKKKLIKGGLLPCWVGINVDTKPWLVIMRFF